MGKRLIVAMMFALSGCASVVPIAPTAQSGAKSESRHVFDNNYTIGVPKSAYVGEPMVKVKDYYELITQADALAASENFRMTLPPFFHPDIPMGTSAQVVGTTTRDGKTYRVIHINFPDVIGLKFLLNDDGTFEGSGISPIGERMGWDYTPIPPAVRFESKIFTKIDRSKGEKNFEIVYSGTTKESLNLLYREYTTEDLARPAFTQNLVYAKESTTVRFREIQLKIEAADNERIIFTVTADGTP